MCAKLWLIKLVVLLILSLIKDVSLSYVPYGVDPLAPVEGSEYI